MDKVYTLKLSYNEYDQLGDYTAVIWRDKPTFHDIKSWFEDEDNLSNCEIKSQVKSFRKQGVQMDAVYGMLFRGEEVTAFGNGGDTLIIVEEELL